MLRRLRYQENGAVYCSDGSDLGTIEDFYFDDETWTVRYVVVKTGNWLIGRSILLSPMAIGRVEWEFTRFTFRLTRDQIKGAARSFPNQAGPARASGDDPHLRSAQEVAGYYIHAQDGEIGHVEDFLIDDGTSTIRYLLVDTTYWSGGRAVLIAPEWTRRIDWPRRQLRLEVTRQVVKDSPEYDPGTIINQTYEDRLANLYRRPVRRA